MSGGFRTVGRSGLVVSELALGTAAFGSRNRIPGGQADVDAIAATALDLGVTLFDTAESYGDERGVSESMLGHALAGRREEAVISTKFSRRGGAPGPPDWGAYGSRRNVRLAVEGSLRRLRTDWIDLYQIHQPDPLTPVEETLAVLDELVREGKVRYTGSSNFAGWQVAEAERTGPGPRVPAVRRHHQRVQPALAQGRGGGAARRDRVRARLPGLLPAAERAADRQVHPRPGAGVGQGDPVQAAPAGTGPWTGLDQLAEFAAKRDLTLVEVAYGWLLAQPGVATLVTGATPAAPPPR